MTKKANKMILTAGPSISPQEVDYVIDAVKTGWNERHADYIHRFEREFAKYIGVKYAMTTSGGTGALWLGLAALGIEPGDEVILPDITYFACSDVVMLLGAKPVFVDILEDTWCIDPEKFGRAITKRTKAVMPVYLYGSLCDMDEILHIAKKHNVAVVEDACPAVGSLYKGRKAGSFGDVGAFSFQGAKIMVTGFGGMLVTNNPKLFERAQYLNGHGEELGKKFWQTAVGYSFEMPNVAAALGLAQLERIEELVARKRQVFKWYCEGLRDLDMISLNHERAGTRSNYWMSSLVLKPNARIKRDELIRRLKEINIDSRPFFYPISMFPMYQSKTKVSNPVSYHVGLNGVNLPSGVMLDEETVDYVARSVRELLTRQN